MGSWPDKEREKQELLEQAYILGENSRDIEVAKLLERAERAEARVTDFTDERQKILSETCARDEQHCTCVPVLRTELTNLEVKIKELQQKNLLLQNELCACWAIASESSPDDYDEKLSSARDAVDKMQDGLFEAEGSLDRLIFVLSQELEDDRLKARLKDAGIVKEFK